MHTSGISRTCSADPDRGHLPGLGPRQGHGLRRHAGLHGGDGRPWGAAALVIALEVFGALAIIVGWQTRLFAFLLGGLHCFRQSSSTAARDQMQSILS